MDTTNLIGALALVTTLIAIAFGFWQYVRTQKAKRNKEHSSFENVSADLRAGGKDNNV